MVGGTGTAEGFVGGNGVGMPCGFVEGAFDIEGTTNSYDIDSEKDMSSKLYSIIWSKLGQK